jgi:hypothetical protein
LEELKHCVRLWPHKIDGEGHFLTLLHKRDLSAHQESIPSSAYIKEYDTKGRSVGQEKEKQRFRKRQWIFCDP